MRNYFTAITIIFLFVNITSSNIFLYNYFKANKMIDSTLSEKTIKIKCAEMSCDACKKSITKSIKLLQGIIKLDINLENKIITVVIDDTKTDEQSVLNAVIEAGYEAEIIK